MTKFQKIEGLIAAPFTPMYEDGSLNTDLISKYYQFLKKNGVVGAFINGSTGEGVSLTQAEKKASIKAWAEASKDDADFKVIALTGGTCLADAKDLAQYAEEIGIHGISFTAPSYFKPGNAKVLAECCTEVASAAPNTAFYYYHIPVLTGCGVPMIDLLHEVDGKIDNFAGIKYTHEDFMDFLSCMNFQNGKYDMLWGRDENMLSALVLGSFGAVGSTYNYAAPLYHQLIESFKKGDLKAANQWQQTSIDMIRLLGKHGGIATGKAFMRRVGLDCGKFRLPIKNMSEQQYLEFVKDTDLVGLDNYKSIL
ncbi:dihydrodipicolinate synthase family protein [Elizabethkingia sp. JS20170427COW]|uniref:dihydrodipicolinate synthase family protein n=1 Tax=Elizabethkingia sp. JS20170427COW TaxID=2583851 RepID=UPI0011108FFF|nr:dihydrodipicolinate synthase family protein [Elizabethkingia sp. JS20170427COW]QCX54265.1 dihydrodipicolinate synthetase [Elizabethkingia sp. JS20170427COW]